MWPNPLETADLVTSTEEIYNGKPIFFFAVFWERNESKSNFDGGIEENKSV